MENQQRNWIKSIENIEICKFRLIMKKRRIRINIVEIILRTRDGIEENEGNSLMEKFQKRERRGT